MKKKKRPEGVGPVCPACGSRNTAGLVLSFWAEIDEHGNLLKQFHEHEADTELGPQRMCSDCNHEWEGEV